jgi:hypothetical protein
MRLARWRMMSREASSAQWASSTITTAGRWEKRISRMSPSMTASRFPPRTPRTPATAGSSRSRPPGHQHGRPPPPPGPLQKPQCRPAGRVGRDAKLVPLPGRGQPGTAS